MRGRNGIQPVNNPSIGMLVVMVISLQLGTNDLHIYQSFGCQHCHLHHLLLQ